MNLGSYYVPNSFNVAKPGVDAHLTGTIPMVKNGDFGCSDTCELNFAKDVYIVDGSCLPSLPSKHCTCTIMANAYRVGENLAKKLTTKIL